MCLFARQSLLQHKGLNFGLVLQNDEEHQKTDDDKIDLVVPFMTLLQVFFYLAWIKVGEEMLNPLGGGESDFEINYIIDRNLSFAMLMADSFAGKFPKQLPDTLLPLHSKAVENIYAGSVSMIRDCEIRTARSAA
uniref:Bestrophin homolog n=1 Tax=Ditylenchus dipsaci TaxID=166011 RepID=A0A915CLJ0_9BILA